ncbi:MAG: DsbA family protein [Patescibacteria group bacterium]
MPQNKIANNNLIQIVLTVLLVGGAFAIGSMWTELKLTKAGKIGSNQLAQNQAAPNGQAAPAQQTQLTDEQWQEVLKDPAATLGKESAKVTMVEFTDYQCPFCEKYYTQTYGQIIKDYVETGKIKYVMRDLPLSFHPFAHVAAEAARCAGEQEKYIKFHDELFKNQAAWVAAKDPTDLFAGYAVKVGLRRADFVSCFKNGKTKEAVDADLALAGKVGAGGTPTFFINGKILVGAQPYSAFQAAIDAALGQ